MGRGGGCGTPVIVDVFIIVVLAKDPWLGLVLQFGRL